MSAFILFGKDCVIGFQRLVRICTGTQTYMHVAAFQLGWNYIAKIIETC